jgi:hypothetical protein
MKSITLTVKEIQDLAMFAGIVLDESRRVDEEDGDTPITVGPCPLNGLRDGDGEEVTRHYRHIAWFEEYPEEGCHGLGEEAEAPTMKADLKGWSKDLPEEQGVYWWWNGDEDNAPLHVSIMYSGSDGSYFAPAGQYGWNRFQPVKEMGGWWMRLREPEVPNTEHPGPVQS